MANRLIAPSLADVSQDIAGVIPIDLIIRWATGDKDSKAHKTLLEPFTVTGTVVSSDSAGLSKLSQNKSLVEVMKLVSEPKEVIFQYGKAIGGTEVGMWAADNTQMFYEQSIAPSDVVTQMIAAQKEMQSLPVKVGLGIHHGEFIQIGGGLFGEDADFVEELAENFTEGGEIIVTSQLQQKITADFQRYLNEKEIKELSASFFSVNYADFHSTGNKSKSFHYPYPFTKDFFRFIRQYSVEQSDLTTYQKYASEKIVILVKVIHPAKKLLLEQLTQWVLANTILKKITLLNEIEEIKSNGSLGIFVTDNVAQAIEFAEDLKDTLAANGFMANVGMSKGEVLIFPLGKGIKEIAGGPVNIASKLAEDSGGEGEVLIENTVNIKGQKTPSLENFSIRLSAVELNGVKF
jgi:hypothetical protein